MDNYIMPGKASKSLGETQRLTLALPSGFFAMVEEIGDKCGSTSQTEVIRDGISLYYELLKLAEQGFEFSVTKNDGSSSKLVISGLAIVAHRAKFEAARDPSLGA